MCMGNTLHCLYLGLYSLRIHRKSWTPAEIVALSKGVDTPSKLFTIAGIPVPVKEAKCLGYWWQSNLGAAKSIDTNIEKRRKAYFAAGTNWCLSMFPESSQDKISFFTSGSFHVKSTPKKIPTPTNLNKNWFLDSVT